MTVLSSVPKLRPFIRRPNGVYSNPALISPLLPTDSKRLMVPFLGGGTVLLHWLGSTADDQTAIATDSDSNIIEAWLQLQRHPKRLCRLVEQLNNAYPNLPFKKKFYAIRNEDFYTDEDCAAQFVWVSNNSYRHTIMYNRHGALRSLPSTTGETRVCTKNMMNVHKHLGRVTFVRKDFRDALGDIQEDDVTFIDPPFIGETMPSSYKLYYIPFDEESHSDLFRWWRSTKNSGHRATMCQTSMAQDHPLLRSETPTLLRKVGKRRGKQYNLIAYTRAAA